MTNTLHTDMLRYYCAGMLRSGSTWQYNVTADLLEGCGLATRGGFAGNEKQLARLIATDNPLVVKLHRPCASALAEVRGGRARVLYIHRDLRDVAASMMRIRRYTLKEVLATGLLDNAWRFKPVWTGLPGVLIQRYEEVIAEPEKAVGEICAFLELDVSRERIADVASSNSIDVQRRKAEHVARMSVTESLFYYLRPSVARTLRRLIGATATHKIGARFGRLGAPRVDPKSLLGSHHVGEGAVGEYKRRMSAAEQRLIEDWLESRMGSDAGENMQASRVGDGETAST